MLKNIVLHVTSLNIKYLLRKLFIVGVLCVHCPRRIRDIFGIDCQWLGLTRSMCAADVVKEYGCLVAPHNFNGHLSTHIAASFSCLVDNFYLLEYDYDDVPWRDELFNCQVAL